MFDVILNIANGVRGESRVELVYACRYLDLLSRCLSPGLSEFQLSLQVQQSLKPERLYLGEVYNFSIKFQMAV